MWRMKQNVVKVLTEFCWTVLGPGYSCGRPTTQQRTNFDTVKSGELMRRDSSFVADHATAVFLGGSEILGVDICSSFVTAERNMCSPDPRDVT